MLRPWRGAVYWLALHGLLSLLSYRTQDPQPTDSTTHNWLDPLSRIINEEIVPWARPHQDLIEAFSQLRLPPL